jgi:hypothetical protein
MHSLPSKSQEKLIKSQSTSFVYQVAVIKQTTMTIASPSSKSAEHISTVPTTIQSVDVIQVSQVSEDDPALHDVPLATPVHDDVSSGVVSQQQAIKFSSAVMGTATAATPYHEPKRVSGKAIASLVCAIVLFWTHSWSSGNLSGSGGLE